ncbi:MAG: restriction endonuclease subunit S [Bacteroidales bacterium]|nr:restriction endonuclease subunit S [Bacteroidales bacterium]
MERYEKYKDSGIEWIGKIPEHWKVKRLKYCISINDDVLNETTDEEFEINYVEIGDVNFLTGINNSTVYKFKNAPSRARRIVKEGDVIVSTVRTYLKAIAQIKKIYGNLIVSTGFAVLRPKTIDSSYLGYYVLTPFFIHKTIADSVGVSYPAINSSNIGLFETVVPSLSEQTHIATFLDRKTAEIDRIIDNKQKLIAFYEEEKQAIINQAVTKGLDPNVTLKDSGVEWLGEIPEHWSLIKLKRISAKITDGEHISPNFTLEGMPFLSAKDVRDGFVQIDYDKFVSNEDGDFFRKRCNPESGDILIVSRGATVGRVAIVDTDEKFCLLGSVILIKPTPRILSKFLLNSFKNKLLLDNFLLTSQSSAQQAIYLVNVAEINLSLPPIQEQINIIVHIEKECSRLDTIIEKFNKQIDLLQEYRITLISEVVTGKIKVPNTIEA